MFKQFILLIFIFDFSFSLSHNDNLLFSSLLGSRRNFIASNGKSATAEDTKSVSEILPIDTIRKLAEDSLQLPTFDIKDYVGKIEAVKRSRAQPSMAQIALMSNCNYIYDTNPGMWVHEDNVEFRKYELEYHEPQLSVNVMTRCRHKFSKMTQPDE